MSRHPLVSSSLVLLLACGLAHADLGNISKVNKSIHVPSGEVAGDVDTVNGSITIASGATVRSAETVNGSIRIEASARAESAETVNGSVRIGTDGVVMRDAETVNGAVQLEARADHMHVPKAFTHMVYTLRLHIEIVRKRIANAGLRP